MRTLNEVIARLEAEFNTEEIVDLLDIPASVLLERFDDYVEERMDDLIEELFDDG